MNGKKFYNYYTPPPNFRGRFINHYPIDKDLYNKKKLETSITEVEPKNERVTHVAKRIKMDVVMALKRETFGLTQKEIARIINLTNVTISKYVREKKDMDIIRQIDFS